MWKKIIDSPLVFILLLCGVILSTAIGFYVQNKILLPLLNVAFAYPVLYTLLVDEKRKRAFVTMLYWAVCLGVVTVWAASHFPERAESSIFFGASYKKEMFNWILTGEGAEGNPVRFVPQHLIHFIIFCILSAVSASLLSLFMGALLMNYMSFYVASLILASNDSTMAALMGWHPWAMIRVASYVILGVIIGEPMICKIVKRDYNYSEVRPFFWAALTGISFDIVLKALLAPWWGLVLRKLIT